MIKKHRFENTKKYVLEKIFFNDRLKTYKEYLEYAREQGYTILNMTDFYQLEDKRSEKHFILRHDVDDMGKSTRKMFEVEKQCGVRSTYYFRFSTMDIPLIKEMHNSGFEVGLHFETISDYAKSNNITEKKDLDLEIIREQLKRDINRFETLVGFKTDSCCSHGDQVNELLGISNNALTEHQNMDRFNIAFEAYEEELYKNNVDCHITDNSLMFNFGFSYPDNPIDAINADKQNIIFLSHPSHWYLTFLKRLIFLRAYILGKGTFFSNKVFHRISQ